MPVRFYDTAVLHAYIHDMFLEPQFPEEFRGRLFLILNILCLRESTSEAACEVMVGV